MSCVGIAAGLRPVGDWRPAAAASPGSGGLADLQRRGLRPASAPRACRAAGPFRCRTSRRTGRSRRAARAAAARRSARQRLYSRRSCSIASTAGIAARTRRAEPAGRWPGRARPSRRGHVWASRFSVSRAASVLPWRRSSSACCLLGERVPGIVRRGQRLPAAPRQRRGRRCRSGCSAHFRLARSRSSRSAEVSAATWFHSARRRRQVAGIGLQRGGAQAGERAVAGHCPRATTA